VAELLQARCPYLLPNQQRQSGENDNVSDWAEWCHHPAKIGHEHYDGCVGCLVLRLQGSIPSVKIRVFLAWTQHAAVESHGIQVMESHGI